MAYTPTNWKDRVVEKPRTYRMQDNGDGTITLIPEPGTIYEPGTPVNAPNLNKLEQGLAAAAAVADAALPKAGGTMTGPLDINTTSNPLRLRAGDSSGGTKGFWQQLFSYNGGTNYTHAIKSRHNSGESAGNAIDFYIWTPVDGAGNIGSKKVFSIVGDGTAKVNDNKVWHRGELRINNGILEFFDGGAWKPVGGGIYTVSDNVLESNATERSTNSGSSAPMLVYKFMPRYNGEVRVKAKVKSSASNADATLWVLVPTFIITSAPSGLATVIDADSSQTPLGTIIDYTKLGHRLKGVSTNQTSYQEIIMHINVRQGIPVFLALSSSGLETVYVSDIRICGTITN